MFNRTLNTLLVVCVVALGAFLSWRLGPANTPAPETLAVADVDEEPRHVILPQPKLDSAAIRTQAAVESTIQPMRTLSGRLDYDHDRHIGVQSACAGILTDIRVRPGDQVTAGQVVAVVSSPELGRARSEVRTRLAQLNLAGTRHQWQKSQCEGVEELVKLIREGKSPQEIEDRIEQQSLGEYREKLVSAYSRSRLASQLAGSSRDAASRGAIAGRLQQQRESERHTSDAAVDAVLEQSLFEARQACKEAETNWAAAELQVQVSLQELNMLLGPAAKKVTIDDIGDGPIGELSSIKLVSPIDGTVEERLVSVAERVAAGDPVFTIADTSHLWAVADIRERDWDAISSQVGQQVQITTPVIANESYLGRVFIVGRRIDPTTGAASIVATLQSNDSRLRPGLFIRMKVPAGPPRTAVVVSEPAVVVHEGQSFVFTPESNGSFRRVDVSVGATEGGLTEITAGLKPGDQVAVAGVFKLKSELLLSGEEE